jgi:hypothetical protein
MSSAEIVRNEMQQSVREIAALADGNRKAAIAFAARALNMPFDRVRRIFYRDAYRIEAHEADRIRAYIQAAHDLIEARADYEKQRREFVERHPVLSLLGAAPVSRVEVPPDQPAKVKP